MYSTRPRRLYRSKRDRNGTLKKGFPNTIQVHSDETIKYIGYFSCKKINILKPMFRYARSPWCNIFSSAGDRFAKRAAPTVFVHITRPTCRDEDTSRETLRVRSKAWVSGGVHVSRYASTNNCTAVVTRRVDHV